MGTSEGGEFSRDNMRNAGTDLGGRAFVMLCGECRVMISGLLEL
ncbi:unnamed protein product, partial [Brassica oleracea]